LGCWIIVSTPHGRSSPPAKGGKSGRSLREEQNADIHERGKMVVVVQGPQDRPAQLRSISLWQLVAQFKKGDQTRGAHLKGEEEIRRVRTKKRLLERVHKSQKKNRRSLGETGKKK